jgi:peptidyl-Asp metalloendopeptidase
MKSYCLLILAGVASPALAASDAVQGAPPDLFTTILVDPSASPPGQYLQSYTVALNLELLKQPAQSLTLNLPGQEPDTVTLVHWEPRRGYIQIPDPDDPTGFGSITIPDPNASPQDFWWRWYGKSAKYTVALTVVDGIVAGRVSSASHRYAIEPTGGEATKLALVNSDWWRTHPEDLTGGLLSHGVTHSPSWTSPGSSSASHAPGTPAGPNWDVTCPGQAPTAPYVIDVLLLYTQGILTRYAGNTSAVHAALQSALDDANQALRNSQVTNIVFSPRGPEFLPNQTVPAFSYDAAPIEDALNRVAGVERVVGPPFYTFPGNTFVSGRRNTNWADVVAVARSDLSGQGTCGVSFVNRVVVNNDYPTEPGADFEKFAYLVYDPGCNADRLNLAHELGHQLGMEHDPPNYGGWWVPGFTTSCPWSFGHKHSMGDPQFRFRTIMAYWENVHGGPGGWPSCGSSAACPQIDAFSTPLLEWANGLYPVGTIGGVSPIGVSVQTPTQYRANNADTVKRLAPIVQDYRARPDIIFGDGFQ